MPYRYAALEVWSKDWYVSVASGRPNDSFPAFPYHLNYQKAMEIESQVEIGKSQALISFGSNLGNQNQIWKATLSQFDQSPHFSVLRNSSLLCTRPIGGPEGQSSFLNAALIVETELGPEQIVFELLEIEKTLGRLRIERWGPRLIDLDLLLMGAEVRGLKNCEVPHPRMTFRQFMMIPSEEIASDWIHPICGKSLGHLLSELRAKDQRVTCVTGSDEKLDGHISNLERMSEKDGQKFKCVSSKQFISGSLPESNLLVFLGESWKAFFCSDWKRPRPSFGPYLWLSGQEEFVTSEFTAALDAMKSL